MSRRRWFLGGLLLLSAFSLNACAGDDATGAVFVEMKDDVFGRDVTRVPVGEPVLFRNGGASPHNAQASDGTWSTEQVSGDIEMQPGADVEIVVEEPGVYEYFCTFHGTEDGEGMAATLVVGDVEFTPGEESEQEVVSEWTGRTIRVPEDHDTIQSAVDAAAPGDLVLIGPGTYKEEVTVTTPSLTLRGAHRDAVVIDGEFERPNGIEVFADGVAIENLTAQNATFNGFFWNGVTGYRGSYLNAYNNADYGIFAFDSRDGLFEHSYASGSPDSGFYIGQCHPCDAIIDHVIATDNSLGYSGTNAGGNLYIVRSMWTFNRAGIVPNTLDSELMPPESETTIVGNDVAFNGNARPVVKSGTYAAFGNGIVIAGGNDNVIERNFIYDHPGHGILVTPNLDENLWFASGNVIRDNIVYRSGRADIALAGPSGEGNCFEDNGPSISTAPPLLMAFHSCDGLRLPLGFDLSTTMGSLALQSGAPEGPVSYVKVASQAVRPEATENLPADSPVQPAVDVFADYDLDVDAIDLPDRYLFQDGEDLMAYTTQAPGVFQLAFNLYGYLLPFLLLTTWAGLALWDLARRDDIGPERGILWVVAVLVVPFLGAIAYHAFGRSRLPAWLRWSVIAGGIGAYAITFGLISLFGGVL